MRHKTKIISNLIRHPMMLPIQLIIGCPNASVIVLPEKAKATGRSCAGPRSARAVAAA